MSALLDLEKQFREIEARLLGARLDEQTGAAPPWTATALVYSQ